MSWIGGIVREGGEELTKLVGQHARNFTTRIKLCQRASASGLVGGHCVSKDVQPAGHRTDEQEPSDCMSTYVPDDSFSIPCPTSKPPFWKFGLTVAVRNVLHSECHSER